MIQETMTRTERLEAALNLQPVDRVPVTVMANEYYVVKQGMPLADLHRKPKAAIAAHRKTFDDHGGWDVMGVGALLPDPFPLVIVLPTRLRLPGVDLPDDVRMQFDESAPTMEVEDYDYVIEHGWDKFVFKKLMPIIHPGYGGGLVGTAKAYLRIGKLITGFQRDIKYWTARDIPYLVGGMSQPPFEYLALARTLNQFFLDLYRRPDVVLQAMEAMLPDVIGAAKRFYDSTGIPRVFVGGTRGSNTFISEEQFDRFYFPFLKRLVDSIIEMGIMPMLHFDSDWTAFVPKFLEFPKGKFFMHFDSVTDIFKAKDILRGHACIMGDVPATILRLGSEEETTEYCKKLIDYVGKDNGFIQAPGCSPSHDAKPENIQAMIDTAKSYYPH